LGWAHTFRQVGAKKLRLQSWGECLYLGTAVPVARYLPKGSIPHQDFSCSHVHRTIASVQNDSETGMENPLPIGAVVERGGPS